MVRQQLINTFRELFGEQDLQVFRAPGRVNLLGEHVDYNGGSVLPAAIDRAVYLAASPNKTRTVQLFAQDLDQEVSFNLYSLDRKRDLAGDPLPDWALYPAGVAWALNDAGLEISGMQAVYSSDIPIGAGLSSSAAVEMAFAVAWCDFGGWSVDRMRLARLCQLAENEYVGVACGLMDQFASAHGVEQHALYFDTRSLAWQAVPLPKDTVLVVANSGVRRSLVSSAYNERRAACEQAVSILQESLPRVKSLRDVSPAQLERHRQDLPHTVALRAEHVVSEIARVEAALKSLLDNDRQTFGALMYAGHASLRDLYQVSTPELDSLVDIAHQLPGCIGARLTGAGFGGCTINLVEESSAGEFAQQLGEGYLKATDRQAEIYVCHASQGAGRLNP